MSNGVNLTKENVAWSSVWGIARGITVHTLIYPLEVVKIRLQCSLEEAPSTLRIVRELLRHEGIGAFYRGLAPQLLKTSLKQVWCWPMMTAMPPFLKRYRIENLGQQALTGVSIATIDAILSTPLVRAKILTAFGRTSKFSLKNPYGEGWKGCATNWSYLSVNWVTFLITQKYLRERFTGQQPLSFPQLIKIGVAVALVVSLVSAPFDNANTRKQAQNVTLSHLFGRQWIFKLYRGWHLNALSLIIHNIASVTLLEKLERRR